MPKIIFYANQESDEESAFLTPWSLPHFLVGAAAKERGIPIGWFELAHLMYEGKDYFENVRDIAKNSLVNSIGDQAIATLGHLIVDTNTQSYKWTILYVVAWVGATALGDRIG